MKADTHSTSKTSTQNGNINPSAQPARMAFMNRNRVSMKILLDVPRSSGRGFLPKIKQTAPSLSNLQLDPFIHAINKVERSKIRIEADEVTYSLHIIIRFELERDLFADKITVDELPEVWNQKYADYLGVKIEDDSEGVMQDTHWASGLYGYFPSYALGNIYSGQITAAINKELPNWRGELADGKLEDVNTWLKTNVHSKSDLFDPEELIKIATGTCLNSQPYLQYLNKKYSELYGI